MPLIKTIEDARAVLPKLFAGNLGDSALPNMASAEATHVAPLTGGALLEELALNLDANILSDGEQRILAHCRVLALAGGLLAELIANHVILTGAGVRTMDTEAMPKAVGWEYRKLEAYLLDQKLAAQEGLLQELWAQQPACWKQSTSYKAFERLLIRGGGEFATLYNLYQPARAFVQLAPHIADVQERYLEEQIGSPLLQYFIAQAAPLDNEREAVRLLKKALAFYTIMMACRHQEMRFAEGGFTVASSRGGDREGEEDGRAAADSETVRRLEAQCEREGLVYLGKAKQELKALRQATGVAPAFVTAFDAGPLVRSLNAEAPTMGNNRRKIFRF